LPINDYGLLSLSVSLVTTLSVFNVASLSLAATRFISKYASQDVITASRYYSMLRVASFFISFIILFICFTFDDFFASLFYPSNPDMIVFHSVVLISVFNGFNSFHIGVLSGISKFKEIAIVNLIYGLVYLPIVVCSAYFFELHGVLLSMCLLSFLIASFSYYLMEKELSGLRISFLKVRIFNLLPVISRFTLPAFLSGVLSTPILFYSNLQLTKLGANGLVQLGYYSAAFTITQLGGMLIDILGQVLTPLSVKKYKIGDVRFGFVNFHLPFLMGCLIFLPLIFFPEIGFLLFGNKFSSQLAGPIVILSFVGIINSLNTGITRNIIASGYMWLGFLVNGIWAINLVVCLNSMEVKNSYDLSLVFLIVYLANFLLFLPFYIKMGILSVADFFDFRFIIIAMLLIVVFGTITFVKLFYWRIILFVIVYCLLLFIIINWLMKYNLLKINS
jgi:O-antigen/teichoic acid export membrane protein